ncbi:MAG: hypothetical protein RR854_00205 [Muribaculaceae bacterium]
MKKIDYSYSGESPVLVQKLGKEYQINFDTEKITLTDMSKKNITQFRSLYARVSLLEYGAIVSAIIGTKYSTSDTEAIMLNYQLGSATPKAEEYKKEYQLLQEWRTHAKDVAKKCLL